MPPAESGWLYRALDDFVYNEDSEPFLDVADIVKIDLLVTDKAEIREVVKRLEGVPSSCWQKRWRHMKPSGKQRISALRSFKATFQPSEMVTAKALAPLHITCFELIAEANKDELDLDLLTRIISRDVSLSYNLLRLVNSAAFARRHPAKTVKDALVFLGQREIRKWVSLIALQRMCDTDLEAPVITSLARGRFVELVAAKTRFKDVKGMLFLCGLFSLLDVLLQRPLLQILEEVGAPEETVELLVYRRGPFKELGSLMLAYEQGQ